MITATVVLQVRVNVAAVDILTLALARADAIRAVTVAAENVIVEPPKGATIGKALVTEGLR